MQSKLKIQILIAAFCIGFGLYNMFWFFVYSPILHTPFPFEHVQAEKRLGGIHIQRDYRPLEVVYYHPYWLFWSLTMYFGIGYLAFLVIRLEKNYRNHVIKKSAKIAVIAGGAGFGLYVVISLAVYTIVDMLPEPEPYLNAEFEGLDVYKSGQPIEFTVYLKGYDYTVSYLEMSIKDHEGRTLWSLEPYIPMEESYDGNYSIGQTIPSSEEGPIIILTPGEYTIEISVSGHTITKSFTIEI